MKNTSKKQTAASRPGDSLSLLRTLGGPVLLLVGLVLAGRYAGQFWPEVERTVESLGYSGFLLFVAAWILLSMTCFPVSVLGVSAGALFGPWLGMALVFPAGLASGSLMFLLGRGLFRARIKSFIATRPKFAAVDRLVGEQALKLNIMTRLSPLNFGLASYTLGAGRSFFRSYFWGLFAFLPSLLAQVWFGSIARAAGKTKDEGGSNTGNLVLLGVGLVFFALLTWLVSRMVKQAWDEAPSEGNQQQDIEKSP
jgi:uncharacterized membrane protein YdjX (TVP38/TMEM64 family)